MKCSKCGKSVNDSVSFCKFCGTKVEATKRIKQEHTVKSKKRIVIVGVIIVFVIIYFLGFKCKAGLCIIPSCWKGDYCVLHTCDRSRCYNKVAEGKEYCYTHMPSTATHIQYTPEKAEDVLSFSKTYVTSNSSYTICTATITSNGRKTYSFVEVKGKFKDSSGKTIDTDWTYAVGSEGLAPGESSSFRLSVDKDYRIEQCDFEILDYSKE